MREIRGGREVPIVAEYFSVQMENATGSLTISEARLRTALLGCDFGWEIW